MTEWKEFKKTLDAEIGQAYELFGYIKRLVELNIYNKDTKKGFLTSELQEYISCLFFDLEKLEGLLNKDDTKWTKSVAKTQERIEEIREKFQELLAM